MPNHFVMGMSLAAFACLVAGIRGSRAGLFFSALLAGALPWVMVQSGLVTLGLAALVLFGDSSLRRTERFAWVSLAALPSVGIVGTFFFWGPFDTFVRTVFLAPFGVIEAAIKVALGNRVQTARFCALGFWLGRDYRRGLVSLGRKACAHRFGAALRRFPGRARNARVLGDSACQVVAVPRVFHRSRAGGRIVRVDCGVQALALADLGDALAIPARSPRPASSDRCRMPRRGYGPSFRSLGEERWGADAVAHSLLR